MIRLRWVFLGTVVVAGVSVAAGQTPSASPPLTALQRSAVERGEPVQILELLPTSPWPRSIVYQFINATPEQCAAVLSDYDLQSTYVPRLVLSRVIGHRGANVTDVEYVVKIPVFPDERSVSRQRVSDDSGAYRIEWHTVFSDSQAKGSRTNGSATFSAMPNSRLGRIGTLMVHDQAVTPNSVFARVPYVRNKAIGASRDAAAAIAHQVERERGADQDLLARQVARLHDALASHPDTGKVTQQP